MITFGYAEESSDSVSAYYYGVCHDCKVYTMLPKCPTDWAEHWSRQMLPEHVGHNLVALHEVDVDGIDHSDGTWITPPLYQQGYTDLDRPLDYADEE